MHAMPRRIHKNWSNIEPNQHLALDLVNGLGEALDVAGGDASYGDPAVLGCIHGVL